MGAWDKDKPAASTSLRSSNPEMLANNAALETAFDAQHDFTTGSTQTGDHDANVITSTHIADANILAANIGADAVTFVKLGCEVDEDDMTSDSAVLVPTQQSVKAYVDSGTVTMTNKTLTSAVLNTAVSGTAVLDEDNMVSDSNTQIATQQSIKAYVDTQIAATAGFSSYTTDDSESNAMLKSHAYKAATDGFVVANAGLNSQELNGYVDDTNDPVGAGIRVCYSGFTESAAGTITFPVKQDEYFEISTASTPTIYWMSIGTLSEPIDQD